MSKTITTQNFYSEGSKQQAKNANAIKLIEYLNRIQNNAPTNIEEYVRLINLINKMIRDDVENINLRYQDLYGNTIFHYGFIFKNPSLLETLVKADPQAALIKNNEGKSPLDVAQKYQLSSKHNINAAINLLKQDESSISSITPKISDTYNVPTIRANNSNSRKRKASELENKNKNSNSKRYKTQDETNDQGSMELDDNNSANGGISTNNSTNIAKEKTPNNSTNFSFNIISSPPITQDLKDAEIAELGKELIEIIDQKVVHKTTGKVTKTIGDTIKLKLDKFLECAKNDFRDDEASFLKILNYQDKHGNTALHIAVFKNYITIGEKLVKLGANPAIQNKEGNTAAHLAAEWGKNTKLLKITKEQCKDIKNNKGETINEVENTEYQKYIDSNISSKNKEYVFEIYEKRFPKNDTSNEDINLEACHLILAKMPNDNNISSETNYNLPKEGSGIIQKVVMKDGNNITNFTVEVNNFYSGITGSNSIEELNLSGEASEY